MNSMNSRLRWRSLTRAWTLPVSRSIPANRLSVPWRMYSWSRAKVAWTPGLGGKSGAVVAIAWIPGFSSQETIVTGFLQDLDFTIDAQDLRHLLFELGVAIFKIVTHLVRLDCLLAKDLAHRSLDQIGQTRMPRRQPVFARMARQEPRCPQLMWMAVVLGLVARQRHQPGLGLRRDGWFLARSRAIVKSCQRAVGQRPLDTALHRLMMDPNSLAHRAERRILPIRQQHLRPRHPARQLSSRSRKRHQGRNLVIAHCQFDRSPPSCHHTAPRFADRKRGIRQQPVRSTNAARSMSAGFMEAVV